MADKPRYRGSINPGSGRTEYVYVTPSTGSASGGNAGGSGPGGTSGSRYEGTGEPQPEPGTRKSHTYVMGGGEPAQREVNVGSKLKRGANYLRGTAARQVKTPPRVPAILGNSRIIKFSWLGAMALVSYESLIDYKVLPPPGRLFWISSTYILLGLLGSVDAMLPLANALAIGFLVTLVYQYYNRKKASA